MASRLNLQQELETMLGTRKVYFSPPETLKLSYPCIVYSMDSLPVTRADNIPYLVHPRYSVIIIDSDPDSQLPTKMLKTFKNCSSDGVYVSDNLVHFSFTLYY